MQGGRAIAELILGLIEPTGRLPITFARHAGQLPVYYNQIRGQHGDRYADLTQEPLFAFGEGLSYTTVEYSDLRLASDQIRPDQPSTATSHPDEHRGPTGDRNRSGLHHRHRHQRHLGRAGTEGVHPRQVRPGESVDVDITIPAADCSIVNAAGHRVVEPGSFDLLVGKSSRDHDLLRVELHHHRLIPAQGSHPVPRPPGHFNNPQRRGPT